MRRLLLACFMALCLMIPSRAYVQQPVCPGLMPGDVIAFIGDSVTYEGLSGHGYLDVFNYLVNTYHPELHLVVCNCGYAYRSETVLNYPGSDPISHQTGRGPWNTLVAGSHPTVVMIWIGIDDFLDGH